MELADYVAAGGGPLRRAVALRAMLATGSSPTDVSTLLGLPRHEIDRLVGEAPDERVTQPGELIAVAGPVLRTLAEMHGYKRLAVFGSVARGTAGATSDIDLIVEPPPGTSSFDFVRFKAMVEQSLGRPVDLVTYGALKAGVDDDIRRDAKTL